MSNLEKDYISMRVNERIQYFSKEGDKQGLFYRMLKLVEILAGFAISIVCAYTPTYENFRIIAVTLSSVALICEGIISLYKCKENWLDYKKTAELLKREKYLYKMQSGVYKDNPESLAMFIEKCEDIISTETMSWVDIQSKEFEVNFQKKM